MQRRELRVIDVVYNLYRYLKLAFTIGFLQGCMASFNSATTQPSAG